jgi:hypothetical protein
LSRYPPAERTTPVKFLGDFLAFIVGAGASGLSFFIAILIGTGGGHGSDATSRVVIAPFAMPRDSLEGGSILPFVGFAFWGITAALLRHVRSRVARRFFYVAAAVHLFSAALTIAESSRDINLFLLIPHVIFLAFLTGIFVRQIRLATRTATIT